MCDASDVVEVERLVKRYRGAPHNAVDGVSFGVGVGEFFALLGPNGAGKTTTISILTTTLAPTSGRVRIAGVDVRRDPARSDGISCTPVPEPASASPWTTSSSWSALARGRTVQTRSSMRAP